MRRIARCLLLVTALPASALAQPLQPTPPPADQTTAPPPGETAPAVEPPPPAPPPPPPAPPPPPEPRGPQGFEETTLPPGDAEEDTSESRPEGFSVGIGIGYDLPTDLQAPDTASVRFRLRSGLTFEPFVVLSFSGSSTDFGDGDSSDDKATEFGLGSNLRIPVIGRGPVDLAVLAGARFDYLSTNPDGPDNNTSSIGTSLVWGLALELWLGAHCALSLNATNPVVSYTSSSQTTFDGETIDDSDWAAGLVFRPDVSFLLHVFL